MTPTKLCVTLLTLAAATLGSGCMFDGLTPGIPRVCEECTAANMGGTGFALPKRGVVIYQGTVKIFDLDRRTFSFIETDPPVMRPHDATIVGRRDAPLSDADYAWASTMTETAWAPPPLKQQRGCATTDGRLPAMVVLVNQAAFYAELECGPEDASGQLSELTARANRIVQQRFGDATPK